MQHQKTEITERNGGVHRQRALKRARELLVGHGYMRPRLYHIVLLDHAAESPTSTRRFQGAIKALCRKLHRHGIPTRWRACIERDDDKGLHCHLFILVDATAANPCAFINAKRYGKQAWLHKMLAGRFMDFHLAQPKADMHRVGGTMNGRRKNYATLANEKLDDCLMWVSYLAKDRSKPSDIRTIYLSSRDNKRPQKTAGQGYDIVASGDKALEAAAQGQEKSDNARLGGDLVPMAAAPIKIRNYAEVVSPSEDSVPQAHIDPVGNDGDWVRHIDDQLPSSTWDADLGCHIEPAHAASNKAKAKLAVAAALEALTLSKKAHAARPCGTEEHKTTYHNNPME